MPITTRPMAAGMIQRVEDAAAVAASCGSSMAGQLLKGCSSGYDRPAFAGRRMIVPTPPAGIVQWGLPRVLLVMLEDVRVQTLCENSRVTAGSVLWHRNVAI